MPGMTVRGNGAVRPERNVLFVIIDQLRADCISGALAGHVAMPHLRALAADAVSFANHFSVTNPCGPSRASILTGQYAMNHRAVRNGTPLAHDMPNLATEARKAGYLPRLYGYTDITPDPRRHDARDPELASYEGVLPGFVEALEMRLEESIPWRAHLRSAGYDVAGEDLYRPNGTRPDDPAIYAAEHSDTAFLTDKVIEELQVRPRGWFAHVTYIRPHAPLVAPAPYNKAVAARDVPAAYRPLDRDAEAAAHPFNRALLAHKTIADHVDGFPDLADSKENAAMLRAIYLGLAMEVDHHIGRILTYLSETGQYDNTLIVVTADHGEMLGDRHVWGKMTYYGEAYHTPLIIRDPEHPACFGTVVSDPTESVDIAPTLLDLIGQEVPDTMNGASLRPFLEGANPAGWRRYSFSELDFGDPVTPTAWQELLGLRAEEANLAVLRSASHVLVHFNGDLPPLLFERDGLREAREITNEPGSEKILLEMSRAMLNHRMAHADGRFARTMVTKDGPVRRPRGGYPVGLRLVEASCGVS